MTKVLAGFFMDGKAGGIDKYLLNFLDAVRMSDVAIDFLTNEIDVELKEKLNQNNCGLYQIANLKKPLQQYRQVCKLIGERKYDIVYLNISTAIDCIAAIAAKGEGVKRRILHSHSSGNDCESVLKRNVFNTIHRICKLFLYRTATEYYGCSKRAGQWMFPRHIVNSDKFKVVYNAIDSSSFSYKEEIRINVRKELGLDDCFVIGHVGNFCYQKNHRFLLMVFKEVLVRDINARLLLIGTGVQFEAIKRLAAELGIEDAVSFLGWRADAERLFQAMDLFLLPSNFEGLPTVGVEAQFSGLPCLMSDTITREAAITDRCHFMSLKESPKVWAQFILTYRDVKRGQNILTNEAIHYRLEKQKEQFLEIIQ